MIERTEPMKVQFGLVINVYKRETGNDNPTAAEFAAWGNKGGHFTDLTEEQAAYILANPTKYFNDEE